jgi:predicted house-cleaning noncanonical NTP pyrophosphatase (MazG superfamily)
MPKFELNKLVRDGLKNEYERTNQNPVFRELSIDELKTQLARKIIEEANEIRVNSRPDEVIDEVADIRQILDDIMAIYDITEGQVKSAQQKKYDKKGGFANGVFVEILELDDNDPWVGYYRRNPDIFPEK